MKGNLLERKQGVTIRSITLSSSTKNSRSRTPIKAKIKEEEEDCICVSIATSILRFAFSLGATYKEGKFAFYIQQRCNLFIACL